MQRSLLCQHADAEYALRSGVQLEIHALKGVISPSYRLARTVLLNWFPFVPTSLFKCYGVMRWPLRRYGTDVGGRISSRCCRGDSFWLNRDRQLPLQGLQLTSLYSMVLAPRIREDEVSARQLGGALSERDLTP